MSKLLLLLQEYLNDQGSSLPPLNEAQAIRLSRFEDSPLWDFGGEIVDLATGGVLYASGVSLFENSRDFLLKPHRNFINCVDEKIRLLCQRHNLWNHDPSLRFKISLPMKKESNGKMYFVTRNLWILHYDPVSSSLIIIVEYHYHYPWDDNYPLSFKSSVFLRGEPHEGLEGELNSAIFCSIYDNLRIPPKLMPVVLCHYHGIKHKHIARVTGLLPSTVNFYNREMLKIFQKFSTFKTAREGVLYFKNQGVVLGPLSDLTR